VERVLITVDRKDEPIGKPIKMWLDDLEEVALDQAKNLANLPFIYKHVALMPDTHMGYGMPIGGVIATKGVIIPNAVGVDIGCGMCAVRTSLTDIDQEEVKKIMGFIHKNIPLGFKKHKEKQETYLLPEMSHLSEESIVRQEFGNAQKQVGTLGGGNHFMEIQEGSDGFIWLMVHSGSRNLGFKVAHHYNKVAQDLNEKWYSSVPKEWELAFLPLDSVSAEMYLEEMNYCVEFAKANRHHMMEKIKACVLYALDPDGTSDISFRESTDVAHNYARLENHFGKNVMVHRKGATSAYEGQLGIIPGSQGTASYVVIGKGNRDSFKSCSHGAGRKMGRKHARKTLDLQDEKSRLDDLGVVHSIRNQKDLDEAPGAYKDIDKVMSNQEDLVDIKVKLTPLGVVKG